MNYLKSLVFLTIGFGILILAGGTCIGLMTTRAFGLIITAIFLLVSIASLLASGVAFMIYLLVRKIVPIEDQLLPEAMGIFLGGLTFIVFFFTELVWMAVNLSEPFYRLVKMF